MKSEHARMEKMIEAEFTGGLPASERAALTAHLRDCEACARLYERYARAERAMTPGAPALTRSQADRVLGGLIGEAPRAPKRSLLPFGALAAAALAGVLFVAMPKEELAPRGGAVIDPRVALRAVVVRSIDGALRASDAADSILRPGDQLRLLYSSPPGFDRVRVQLIDDKGEAHPILEEPIAPATEGKLTEKSAVDPAWAPGPARIVATFLPAGVDRTIAVTVGGAE